MPLKESPACASPVARASEQKFEKLERKSELRGERKAGAGNTGAKLPDLSHREGERSRKDWGESVREGEGWRMDGGKGVQDGDRPR